MVLNAPSLVVPTFYVVWSGNSFYYSFMKFIMRLLGSEHLPPQVSHFPEVSPFIGGLVPSVFSVLAFSQFTLVFKQT